MSVVSSRYEDGHKSSHGDSALHGTVKTVMDSDWSHEESYKGFNAVALAHRNRLKHIINLFCDIQINDGGALADFGCSNGYIISVLQNEVFQEKHWGFYGFDHTEHLLSKAKARNLPSSEFHFFDLNEVNQDWKDSFDIVTCFETLEHTGDYRNAFVNLYTTCRKGGHVVLSIPNERGLPGILKYITRKVMRRQSYGDFFHDKSEWEYVKALILGRPIEVFRHPGAQGWGPHLGFDYKQLEEFILGNYVKQGKMKTLFQGSSALNFTRLYVFRKLD